MLDSQEVYRNIHTQIIRASILQNTITKSKKFRPNVIMMIFDSTSSSSGQRSLAQTMQVLRYKYDAITFRGHNKVGYGSRPNAWAVFMGVFYFLKCCHPLKMLDILFDVRRDKNIG